MTRESSTDVVKKVFTDGDELTLKKLVELQQMKFEITDENKHYKVRFKNRKYCFIKYKQYKQYKCSKFIID